jgi:hypothetical protein
VTIVTQALGDRQLADLVALTGLDAQFEPVRETLRVLMDQLPDTPARPSGLTSSGYPVELGVTIDRGGAVGLKYTIDLLASGGVEDVLEMVRRGPARLMCRFTGNACPSELERCVRVLLERSSGAIGAVYWSIGFGCGAPPRMKLHLIGREDVFVRRVLEGLVPFGVDASSVDTVLEAAASVGRSAVDFIGLGVDGAGRVRCKAYLSTNPFLDLQTLTRLATALRLSTGRALSLVKWYRHFIGDSAGQMGAFGVGVDLVARSGQRGIEAYTYPSPVGRARLRPPIDVLARSRGRADTLRRLWELLDRNDGSEGGMYLAGCGTETATFARLGRMTVYLGIGDATARA